MDAVGVVVKEDAQGGQDDGEVFGAAAGHNGVGGGLFGGQGAAADGNLAQGEVRRQAHGVQHILHAVGGGGNHGQAVRPAPPVAFLNGVQRIGVEMGGGAGRSVGHEGLVGHEGDSAEGWRRRQVAGWLRAAQSRAGGGAHFTSGPAVITSGGAGESGRGRRRPAGPRRAGRTLRPPGRGRTRRQSRRRLPRLPPVAAAKGNGLPGRRGWGRAVCRCIPNSGRSESRLGNRGRRRHPYLHLHRSLHHRRRTPPMRGRSSSVRWRPANGRQRCCRHRRCRAGRLRRLRDAGRKALRRGCGRRRR